MNGLGQKALNNFTILVVVLRRFLSWYYTTIEASCRKENNIPVSVMVLQNIKRLLDFVCRKFLLQQPITFYNNGVLESNTIEQNLKNYTIA